MDRCGSQARPLRPSYPSLIPDMAETAADIFPRVTVFWQFTRQLSFERTSRSQRLGRLRLSRAPAGTGLLCAVGGAITSRTPVTDARVAWTQDADGRRVDEGRATARRA